MTIRLKIYDCKYDTKGRYIDETWFSGNLNDCKVILRKSFRSYAMMANFLDKTKRRFVYTVMYANHKKVVFDGVSTWVEDRGNI